MADKGGNGNLKKGKLELLKEWEHIEEVYRMIEDNISPNQINKYINDHGFKLSVPATYTFVKNYKSGIVQQAHARQIKEIDKKIKDKGIKNNKQEMRSTPKEQIEYPEPPEHEQRASKKMKNDIELLDSIIQLGMDTISQMEALSPQVAISAIRLKSELTDGDMTSGYGIESIRLREQAREQAMLMCIQRYVDPSKWDELLDMLEAETKKFYESMGMLEAYEQAKQIEGD